mgnify:CR=1 FL=1
MKTRTLVIGFSIAVALAIAAFLWGLYSIYLWIRPTGIVQIDARAVDHGDYIVVDMRVENVDTSRYLSNFFLTFLSYSNAAYTVAVRSIVPDALLTNYYRSWTPPLRGGTYVIWFNPDISVTHREHICVCLHLTKVTSNTVSKITGSVHYRGKRIFGEVHPLSYGAVLFRIPVEQP